ncbi:MAG: hypothetical protein AB7O78_09105 [Thermoleophilia bacterium]
MRRTVRRVPLALACVAAIAVVTSGCATLKVGSSGGGPFGTASQGVEICASGPAGENKCPALGNSQQAASSGFRQLLVGAQIPDQVGAPTSITTQAPQSLTFTSSPGYAAELQRLSPAFAGRKWVAWISPAINYDATDTSFDAQHIFVRAVWQLLQGPDGSPYSSGTLTTNWTLGWRNVTTNATAARPVNCGDSLTALKADVPDANDGHGPGVTFCQDATLDMTNQTEDYGVMTPGGGRATGQPGTLVTMPFVLRSGNIAPPASAPFGFPVKVTSTLPGATLAVTPEPLTAPPLNGDATALVAVGIPAGAAPGTYTVTATVDLSRYGAGASRAGTTTLTVLAPPRGGSTVGGGGGTTGGGGRKPSKRKLTTILPKGLPVGTALASGVPVLLGSNVAGPALVRFQQGPRRKPIVSVGKRIRLKAPGPVKVTFRSRKLVKGPFRVSIAVSGKVVKSVSGRLVR